MTPHTHHVSSSVLFVFRLGALKIVIASLSVVLMVVLSACQGRMLPAASTSLSAGAAPSAHVSLTTPALASSQVKVYFSKFPDSETKFTAVFPVDRISPTLGVATFSIQLLIAGPTTDERSKGYFSELNSLFTGPSTCLAPHPIGGPDFHLALNKKGSQAEQGTATLQFCRATASAGIGTDARVQAQIATTLKQFATIKKVVILDQNGHCFGDGSGQDRCLK